MYRPRPPATFGGHVGALAVAWLLVSAVAFVRISRTSALSPEELGLWWLSSVVGVYLAYRAARRIESGHRFVETIARQFAQGDFSTPIRLPEEHRGVSSMAEALERARHEIGRDRALRNDLNRQLEHARLQAESAYRAKEQFLANMSHEVRTPLNGVLGMLEILLETELEPEQREMAETAATSGEALLSIVSDVLDLSQAESGALELVEQPFDLRKTLEETTSLLSTEAIRKGVELHFFVQEDVPTRLIGDRNRLRQVLLNLVGNGVKFTEEGEVAVRVSEVSQDGESARMRFDIIDTGSGLSAGEQATLFEAFHQADESSTREYGGTGLGLAISRELVQCMAGTIGVESVEGHGSTFWFELPFKLDDRPAAPAPDARQLIGRRALVVEDNATSMEILEHHLSAFGMTLDFALDAEEGLALAAAALAQGAPHELILTDLRLPGLDGQGFARRVRELAGLGHTPIVAISAFADALRSDRAAKACFAAVLTKPLRRNQLLEVLTELVGRLSVDVDAVPAPLPSRPAPCEASASAADRPAGRVLVVEDHPVNQRVTERALFKLGYGCEIASDGGAAVEAYRHGAFVAILMDCQMPGMDGYEATRRIRALEPGGVGAPPIIGLSAAGLGSDRSRAFAAGMSDYMTKPLRLEELRAVLERAVLEQTAE